MCSSVAACVFSPTRIPLTGAAVCRRAAVLITSPATKPSPASARASTVTSASPVFTASRTSTASSSSAQSRIASAARTARSASSSWTTGAPTTATTASPMNFSAVPPRRSSSERTRAWYDDSSARTSSGSDRSARAVDPTRSQNTTVTIFRSSTGRAAGARRAPHSEQNFAPAAFCEPHDGHFTAEAYAAVELQEEAEAAALLDRALALGGVALTEETTLELVWLAAVLGGGAQIGSRWQQTCR